MNSYWNNNGTYQDLADRLAKRIPAQGEVNDPRGRNRRLEKFRKASNCYYDMFNNGLCNRAKDFRKIFGFAPRKLYADRSYGRYSPEAFNNIMERLEPLMDAIILAAAQEQGYIEG